MSAANQEHIIPDVAGQIVAYRTWGIGVGEALNGVFPRDSRKVTALRPCAKVFGGPTELTAEDRPLYDEITVGVPSLTSRADASYTITNDTILPRSVTERKLPWPFREAMTARCLSTPIMVSLNSRMVSLNGRHEHDERHAVGSVPILECRCGIYALKDPIDLVGAIGSARAEDIVRTPMVWRREVSSAKDRTFDDLFTSPEVQVVVGKIALWGKVIEGSVGYRAQYARPLSLIHLGEGDVPIQLRLLADSYGIPVEHHRELEAVLLRHRSMADYERKGSSFYGCPCSACTSSYRRRRRGVQTTNSKNASVGLFQSGWSGPQSGWSVAGENEAYRRDREALIDFYYRTALFRGPKEVADLQWNEDKEKDQ